MSAPSPTVAQSLEAGRRKAKALVAMMTPAQATRAGALLGAAMKAQQATQDDAA